MPWCSQAGAAHAAPLAGAPQAISPAACPAAVQQPVPSEMPARPLEWQLSASLPPSWSGIPRFPLPPAAVTGPAWQDHKRPQK